MVTHIGFYVLAIIAMYVVLFVVVAGLAEVFSQKPIIGCYTLMICLVAIIFYILWTKGALRNGKV